MENKYRLINIILFEIQCISLNIYMQQIKRLNYLLKLHKLIYDRCTVHYNQSPAIVIKIDEPVKMNGSIQSALKRNNRNFTSDQRWFEV
jgi:hypothetical protein